MLLILRWRKLKQVFRKEGISQVEWETAKMQMKARKIREWARVQRAMRKKAKGALDRRMGFLNGK